MERVQKRDAGCLENVCCILGLPFIFMPGKFLVCITAIWIDFTTLQLNGWSILTSILIYATFYWLVKKKKIYYPKYIAAGAAYFLYSITAVCTAITMLIIYLICDGTSISATIEETFLWTLWL